MLTQNVENERVIVFMDLLQIFDILKRVSQDFLFILRCYAVFGVLGEDACSAWVYVCLT